MYMVVYVDFLPNAPTFSYVLPLETILVTIARNSDRSFS